VGDELIDAGINFVGSQLAHDHPPEIAEGKARELRPGLEGAARVIPLRHKI
jgi:hypothetical protein